MSEQPTAESAIMIRLWHSIEVGTEKLEESDEDKCQSTHFAHSRTSATCYLIIRYPLALPEKHIVARSRAVDHDHAELNM